MVKSRVGISYVFLFISIALLIVHFLFFRYSFPPVNIDEASFFSPAYSFATTGHLSSDVHKSFLPGAGQYTYWMPPLYMVVLGSVLKLFGATVLNAKLLSLFFIALAAYLITLISNDRYVKLSVSSLLLICPFVLITSAFIRMEAMAILLIVIAINLVKSESKSYIIGILTGLLLMTHPMVVPCAAAIGVVMLRRGWKSLLIFSVVTLVVLTPYLLYIMKDVEAFKTQMQLQFVRKSNASITGIKLSYLMQSVPFAFIGFYCLYRLKGFKETKWFLATGILLTLLLVLKSNEFNYQVYLIPYVVASIGLLMNEMKHSSLFRFVLPGAVYTFFLLLLVSKAKKYHFLSDKPYEQVLSYLETNKEWSGKNIYVIGNPDVSTFFMMNHQKVERKNAVATAGSADWYAQYNYVVEVHTNFADDESSQTKADSLEAKPWMLWSKKNSFTTSDGLSTIDIYSR